MRRWQGRYAGAAAARAGAAPPRAPAGALQRVAALDQNPVCGADAGADHDRRGRGQAQGAGAGDDQDRDAEEQGEEEVVVALRQGSHAEAVVLLAAVTFVTCAATKSSI